MLVASAQDPIGQSRTASSVWVANGDEWWFAQADNDRIDILPEKSNYEPGETAKFQIRMPFRSALTLITVEREGVVDAFLQRITRANPIFEMPVLERYGPNIVVSALVIRGRNDSVQPLGMVDLGKPSVKLGMTKLRVGGGGYALRVEVTTERKKSYQVRETVRGTVQVQTPDQKRPSDRGIYDGEVAIAVIDEALLELKRNDTWQLLDAMTGERETSISTVTSGMYIIGKRHFGQKALPFGGGGGELRSREIFDPEVYLVSTRSH